MINTELHLKNTASVTKIFEISASHNLPNHKGKCKNAHGHNYRLEVTVTGYPESDTSKSDYGMVIDYSELKQIVNDYVVDKLDHKCLNDVFDYTTTELMANHILYKLNSKIETDRRCVSKVVMWESSTSNCTVNNHRNWNLV